VLAAQVKKGGLSLSGHHRYSSLNVAIYEARVIECADIDGVFHADAARCAASAKAKECAHPHKHVMADIESVIGHRQNRG
jgi:hypothetical protein